MERRQYLAAAALGGAVGIGGVGGYTLLTRRGHPPIAEAEFPPYPDSRTVELSGDGAGISDSFELENDGPTFIETEVDQDGNDEYNVILQGATEDNETIEGVVSVFGPFVGRIPIPPVQPGTYELNVEQASGPWEATVYDLPAYDDGTGLGLPLGFNDTLYTVIGPINFSDGLAEADESQLIDISFTLENETERDSTVTLLDREGAIVETVIETSTTEPETVERDLGGVGYIAITSATMWRISVDTV